ncbi:MAG: Cna B-type domain-containing protein, partial [Oscillospiraceae bacterium]|nr:Cna B-type domain-containing protein [Oscillospiraceae bacterium]
ANRVTTLTNTHTPEVTSITVKKVWNDSNDMDRKRSGVEATITLKKTADGVTTDVESVTVGTANDWSKTWESLPVYENKKAVSYSVVETLTVANTYTSDTTEPVTVANGGTKIITNTHIPNNLPPKTGDNTRAMPYILAMGVSAAALVLIVLAGRKKKNNEE